jgi:monoamine oxidase
MRSLPDFWDQLSQITDKLSARKAETVADYLRRQKRPLPLFRSYVEGFYAADLDKIGVDDLARAEHEPEQSWHGRDLFRPYPDYSSFLKHLFQWQTVHLAQEVTDIEWNADRVSLHTRGGRSFQARRLVITVPLSVLKARRIRFAPEIPELDQALEHLHMGHVQRLVFEFDVQIWEKLSREPVSFLHHLDSEKSFPTWWTQAPRHAPFLVGWQGGPKAEAMAQWPSSKVHAEALQSLARLCGTTVAVLQRHLVHVHAHNWSTDSFTLGAYSYPGPNGEAQARRLQKPFAKTLFFAGEATQDGSLRGTVTGAVLSGERAAKQVVASL